MSSYCFTFASCQGFENKILLVTKSLLYSILVALSLVSCDNYKNYRLDGMWQLKTVQNEERSEIKVDTVFYSFQRETVFSFTLLENSKFAAYPVYGYMNMLSDHKVHILIHNYSDDSYIKQFLSLSG
jgi:hypothetical protein